MHLTAVHTVTTTTREAEGDWTGQDTGSEQRLLSLCGYGHRPVIGRGTASRGSRSGEVDPEWSLAGKCAGSFVLCLQLPLRERPSLYSRVLCRRWLWISATIGNAIIIVVTGIHSHRLSWRILKMEQHAKPPDRRPDVTTTTGLGPDSLFRLVDSISW